MSDWGYQRALNRAERVLERAEQAEADLAAAQQQLDQVRELCTPDDSVVTYGTRRPALYMSEVLAILDAASAGETGAVVERAAARRQLDQVRKWADRFELGDPWDTEDRRDLLTILNAAPTDETGGT